ELEHGEQAYRPRPDDDRIGLDNIAARGAAAGGYVVHGGGDLSAAHVGGKGTMLPATRASRENRPAETLSPWRNPPLARGSGRAGCGSEHHHRSARTEIPIVQDG